MLVSVFYQKTIVASSVDLFGASARCRRLQLFCHKVTSGLVLSCLSGFTSVSLTWCRLDDFPCLPWRKRVCVQ